MVNLKQKGQKMNEKTSFSWLRMRTTEELGDFVARLTEKRRVALECVTLED
jgi:hypothetical protein